MRDAVVGMTGECGRGPDRHAALENHLCGHIRACGVDTVGEFAHPLGIARVAEEPGPMGADARWVESGRQRIGDERGGATDPLHPARDFREPHGAVLFERFL